MPTKAQTDNLKPIKKGQLSSEEAKAGGSAGGKASVQARREKKIIREEILKAMSETDWQEMIANVIMRAKESDKAFEVLRDTIGQKPVEKVENTLSFDLGSAKFTDGDS